MLFFFFKLHTKKKRRVKLIFSALQTLVHEQENHSGCIHGMLFETPRKTWKDLYWAFATLHWHLFSYLVCFLYKFIPSSIRDFFRLNPCVSSRLDCSMLMCQQLKRYLSTSNTVYI